MQKHVNLVDLFKSFPTKIYLQNLASIQKRTSPVKFGHLAEKSENRGSISNLSTKVLVRRLRHHLGPAGADLRGRRAQEDGPAELRRLPARVDHRPRVLRDGHDPHRQDGPGLCFF